MSPLQLYRADQKRGSFMSEEYAKEGLLTKQLNNGDDPEPFKKYGWLRTITSHIHADNNLNQFIHDHTAFLSFTTDHTISELYLSTKENKAFATCNRAQSEAFIITFSINLSRCTKLGNGAYYHTFYCNYDKIRTHPDFLLSSTLAPFINCNICKPFGKQEHHLLIIDAVTYLSTEKDLYPLAYANALRDEEWLLLPGDPMVGGPYNIGLQSRIPVSDSWNLTFYNYNRHP